MPVMPATLFSRTSSKTFRSMISCLFSYFRQGLEHVVWQLTLAVPHKRSDYLQSILENKPRTDHNDGGQREHAHPLGAVSG